MGMKMSVTFDSFSRQFALTVKGDLSHTIVLGSDPIGNITRINNILENMGKQLEESVLLLSNVEHQLETAKEEVKKPFIQETELKEKLGRLAELNSMLDMDEKGDEEIAGDETPEVQAPEQKKTKDTMSL